MPPATAYSALVAANVRSARSAAVLSQDDVAARMRDLGFPEWRRQTVGNVERARRRLSIEEVLGLMVVFGTDLTALAYPQAEHRPVALPGGQTVVLPAARFSYDVRTEGQWQGNVSTLTRESEPTDG